MYQEQRTTEAQRTGTTTLRILVPLDGSAQALRALAFAAKLPAREIAVLRVQPNELMSLPGTMPNESSRETDEVRTELESIAEPFRSAERSVHVEVRFGDVAEEIIEAAGEFDLIVMTTHGRGAAGRILFGSNADRVSRYSTTPTLLIRQNEEGADVPTPTRIVVPLDGSAVAERALPSATALADALSLPLHLLRSVGLDHVRGTIREMRHAEVASTSAQADADATYEAARQQTERQATDYLTDLANEIESARGIDVQTGILQGTAAFVLLWELEADDLVVMTSHGESGYKRWLLGSVAEKLVREAKAPVLLVPTRDKAS